METPEEKAAREAREAVEDAGASGGFEDDLGNEPVLTPSDVEDDEIVVPEGAEDEDKVKNLIKAERKAARDANARARELEAELAEIKGKPAPVAAPDTPDAKAAAAETKALRLEVGMDKGMSKTFALLLQGATREEMESHADALLAEMGTRPSAGGMDGGFRPTVPPPAVPPAKAHNDFVVGLLTQVQQTRGE